LCFLRFYTKQLQLDGEVLTAFINVPMVAWAQLSFCLWARRVALLFFGFFFGWWGVSRILLLSRLETETETETETEIETETDTET
jgi:hypothetical protein